MTAKQREIEEWKKQLHKAAGDRKLVFDKEIIEGAEGLDVSNDYKHLQTIHAPDLKDLRKYLKDFKKEGKRYILHYVEEHIQTFGLRAPDFKPIPLDQPNRSFVFVGEIST